jgi:hypothetical protein
MDESVTAEERAALKDRAIKRLRDMKAELERTDQIHRFRERGMTWHDLPSRHESMNQALRDLQRAGENIPDWMIRPPVTHKWRASTRAPLQDWIDGWGLLSDVNRALEIVDLSPE